MEQAFRPAFGSAEDAASAAEVRHGYPLSWRDGQGHLLHYIGTYLKKSLFQSDRMANLFLEVLGNYRSQHKFLLHEFVLMPDHFHMLLTPTETLEKAVQLIKGGFSSSQERAWIWRRDLGAQLS